MKGDLHTHSTYSDGTLTPKQLIQKAKELQLEVFSLTDHDSVAGIPEAQEECKPANIFLIPGVEINTDTDNGEVHVLGYFIDPANQELSEQLEQIRKNRRERARKILEKLKEIGIFLSMEDVAADMSDKNESLGRPHVAKALLRAGHVKTMGEAFSKYLSAGCPAYIRRAPYHPVEAVKLIARAGGTPVLAHPGFLKGNALLNELIEAGLAGIEAYYGGHTEEQTHYYLEVARKNNLLATCGSDFHGPGSSLPYTMTAWDMPEWVVERVGERVR